MSCTPPTTRRSSSPIERRGSVRFRPDEQRRCAHPCTRADLGATTPCAGAADRRGGRRCRHRDIARATVDRRLAAIAGQLGRAVEPGGLRRRSTDAIGTDRRTRSRGDVGDVRDRLRHRQRGTRHPELEVDGGLLARRRSARRPATRGRRGLVPRAGTVQTWSRLRRARRRADRRRCLRFGTVDGLDQRRVLVDRDRHRRDRPRRTEPTSAIWASRGELDSCRRTHRTVVYAVAITV